MSKAIGKIEIPYPETIFARENSGEIKFVAYVEGFSCDVRVPCCTGHEYETLVLMLKNMSSES